jgi:KDO2-lipid IV(A) lauroyltransferase
MEEVGALAAEMGHVWGRPWSEVSPLIVATTGTELIAQAQSEGRGVIVFAPHLGNWEVLGLHVATLGKTVALFEPPTMASIGDFIHQARQRSGSQLVPTTPRGIAELVKSVRRGGITGILPDQVPDDEQGGLNVPFMGVRCHTPTLACNLLQRSGALAVTGVAVRVKGGFAIRYALASPDVYSDDLSVALTAMNSDVERCLRGIDEQYQWQYKRFRCRPTGPIDHYLHLMQRQ